MSNKGERPTLLAFTGSYRSIFFSAVKKHGPKNSAQKTDGQAFG
jgi:hypothetical protein